MDIDILCMAEITWLNSGVCRKNGKAFNYFGITNPNQLPKAMPRACQDCSYKFDEPAIQALLQVIISKIFRKWKDISTDTQFGFTKGLGTKRTIFSMKLLWQKMFLFALYIKKLLII